jgi:hypothetical protein
LEKIKWQDVYSLEWGSHLKTITDPEILKISSTAVIILNNSVMITGDN